MPSDGGDGGKLLVQELFHCGEAGVRSQLILQQHGKFECPKIWW